MEVRFPDVIETVDDAVGVLANLSVQHLWTGFAPDGPAESHSWGLIQPLRSGEDRAAVPVVLTPSRHRGHLAKWVDDHPHVRLAIPEPWCELRAWAASRGVRRETLPLYPGPEYAAIRAFYGNRRAKRSGAFLMNHIDEGLFLLGRIGASEVARRAWCLHPLIQADDDLARMWANRGFRPFDPAATFLALEYRNVANRHLSRTRVTKVEDIALSPIAEVNDLLRVDKIQNRRDFERLGKPSAAEHERLTSYFGSWFGRLGVGEGDYAAAIADIDARTSIRVAA
jgi:hypothetical protein